MSDLVERTAADRSIDPPHVGFPCETTSDDRRAVLTPSTARLLVDAGFHVLAEAGLGAGVGLADEDYERTGVHVVAAEEAWRCPLVIRYRSGPAKCLERPAPSQAIGAIFHAEGDPDMLRGLRKSGVRAFAFEFVAEAGRFPMAVPGGRIAGAQAVLAAAQALQAHHGGRGVLLADVPGAPRPRVVVIGSGTVGTQAALTAAALGATVTVLARDRVSAARYAAVAPPGVEVAVNTREMLCAALQEADVVIGAILVSTFHTPPMISADDLALMRPGSVIVDVTCGYGPGYLPSAGPVQQPGQPPRVVGGVQHIKLDSLPALVPVTATHAYAAMAGPYLVRLAEHVLRGRPDSAIEAAQIAADGRLTHPVLVEHADYYGVGL